MGREEELSVETDTMVDLTVGGARMEIWQNAQAEHGERLTVMEPGCIIWRSREGVEGQDAAGDLEVRGVGRAMTD